MHWIGNCLFEVMDLRILILFIYVCRLSFVSLSFFFSSRGGLALQGASSLHIPWPASGPLFTHSRAPILSTGPPSIWGPLSSHA